MDASTNEALAKFGELLGIEKLNLADGKSLELSLDNNVDLKFTYDPETSQIVIESALGNWPNGQGDIWGLLLKSNYYWTESKVQFAVNPENEEVVVFATVSGQDLMLDEINETTSAVIQANHNWTQMIVASLANAKSDPSMNADSNFETLRV